MNQHEIPLPQSDNGHLPLSSIGIKAHDSKILCYWAASNLRSIIVALPYLTEVTKRENVILTSKSTGKLKRKVQLAWDVFLIKNSHAPPKYFLMSFILSMPLFFAEVNLAFSKNCWAPMTRQQRKHRRVIQPQARTSLRQTDRRDILAPLTETKLLAIINLLRAITLLHLATIPLHREIIKRPALNQIALRKPLIAPRANLRRLFTRLGIQPPLWLKKSKVKPVFRIWV